MGLFDKVKNLFTEPEEPEEEIKVEQIKREVTRTPIESRPVEHKREKVVPIDDVDSTEEQEVVEEELTLSREKIKTPIFFTENDFADLEPERPKKTEKKKEPDTRREKREEKKQPYSGGYTSTSILTKEKPTFKPTPIISPIYGILDKNYSKDDIVEKKEFRESKTTDGIAHDRFDEVRNKAYGTLETELEDTIYSETKKEKKNKKRSKLDEFDLFDELEKEEKANKKIKLEDTAELAKTVTEQEKNIRELEEITMDLTKELDNLLLKKESYNEKKEKIIHNQNEEDDAPLTENELFNLIDSMYEEGKE